MTALETLPNRNSTPSVPSQCVVQGLGKRFGNMQVVADVSLDITKGEFVVFLGPSGCGKTTTLRMIAGLEIPTEGKIRIADRLVSAPAQKVFVEPRDRGIGMVFQSYAVWPHMTVFENVAYPLRVRGWKRADMTKKVGDVLELVGLSGQERRPATALSGGQMQRIALARALVFDPAMLLFDEPLSNLDLKLRERLRVELKALQARTGITSIYVTHDQTEAVELGDRVVVMEAGRVVQVGTPAELYQQPKTRFVAEFIGSANIRQGRVHVIDQTGIVHVRTDHGEELRSTADAAVRVGDSVDIVIHPEDCRLVASPDAPDGAYAVRVIERRYQGVMTRYKVDWKGMPLDVISMGTSSSIEDGSLAWMLIDRSRLIRRADGQ